MQMRFLWLSGALLAAVLAGCAGSQRLVPKVEQGQAEGGAKTVTVASESVACSRPQCPVLAAAWTSAKAGQAVLTVGLPYQKAEVTGADFHFGGSQTVHVRSRSRASSATSVPVAHRATLPATSNSASPRTTSTRAGSRTE